MLKVCKIQFAISLEEPPVALMLAEGKVIRHYYSEVFTVLREMVVVVSIRQSASFCSSLSPIIIMMKLSIKNCVIISGSLEDLVYIGL